MMLDDTPPYTPDALRSVLTRHGLTSKQAGKMLGVDPRTIRKWTAKPDVASHRDMPASAWLLLLILVGEVEIS